jgi:tetratricopeptide (TPR) repeat protein
MELMIDIRFAQDNPSAAVELLKMLGGLFPQDPTILQRRAEARLLQGDDAAARRDLDLAIENGLPFPSTDAALGPMYEKLRRNQQALDAYTMALAQTPDDIGARIGRIRMLARLNHIAEALKECEAVVAANPDDPNLLMLRATFREQLRDEAGSLADWREVLRLRPNDETARWSLTRLLLYAADPSLRNPIAAAALAGSDASDVAEPSQTDHRIRAHLYFAQQQYERSADEMNQLGKHRLADWMVVSQLRAQGLDVRSPDIQTEIPVNVDMSLPPWLRDLSIVWSATEGQDKEKETEWIPSGPEQ